VRRYRQSHNAERVILLLGLWRKVNSLDGHLDHYAFITVGGEGKGSKKKVMESGYFEP